MRSFAHKEHGSERFFPFRQWMLFFILSALLVVFSFPEKSVVKSFVQRFVIDPVSSQYLVYVIQRETGIELNIPMPHDFSSQKINQLLTEIDRIFALPNHQANAVYAKPIAYALLRWLTYAIKPTDPERIIAQNKMKSVIPQLLAIKLSQTQYLSVADDCLGLEIPQWSMKAYEQLFHYYPDQKMAVILRAKKTALLVQAYQAAAHYQGLALIAETNPDEKINMLIEGVKILMSGNVYPQAIQFADTYLKDVPRKQSLFFELSELALQCNNPVAAKDFLVNGILLGDNTK